MKAIGPVADIMARELNWSRNTKQKQIEAAKAYIASYGGREVQ